MNRASALKTGMWENGAASRAKVLHTSVLWDGLTAVNGVAEEMTHSIIESMTIDNLKLSVLRNLTYGETSSLINCLI